MMERFKTAIIHCSGGRYHHESSATLSLVLNSPPEGYEFHSLTSAGDNNYGGLVYTIVWEYIVVIPPVHFSGAKPL